MIRKKVVLLLAVLMIGMIPANAYAEDVETIEYTEVPELENIEELPAADAGVFTSRRLIVIGDVQDTYGAVARYELPDGEAILEYDDEAAAKSAYDKLSQDYECYPDEVIEVSICGDLSCEEEWCQERRENPLEHDVTVAVLDTGAYTESSYLAGRLLSSSYDYIRGTSELVDLDGHGTHVAGIVAKNTPDNVGIMSLRVLSDVDGNGSGVTTTLIIGSAIKYALNHGADVINMSLDLENASEGSLTYLDAIIQDAYDRGVVTCVAAGNSGREISDQDYPACIGAAVTVGSVDGDNRLSSFSNYGASIDFVAPGENILSAGTEGADSTARMSGTSMAVPYVAACLAYLAGDNPDSSAQDQISMLRDSALDLGVPGRDDKFGWGIPRLAYEPPHEHKYTKEITSAATCETTGIVTFSCEDCGEEYTEELPASGHSWISEEQNVFICADCGTACDEDISGEVSGISWTLESAGRTGSGQYTYKLILSGSGAIGSPDSYPWTNFRNTITDVRFDGDITEIGDGAFDSFSNLTHVEYMNGENVLEGFPASLKSIGTRAFFGCHKLKTIHIPEGLLNIGDGAFSDCRGLNSFHVDESNSAFTSIESEGFANLYDKSVNTLVAGTSGNLLATVKEIRPYACYGCEMSELVLGESIERIGEQAFGKCFKLSSIYIDCDKIDDIAQNAFTDVQADVLVDEQFFDGWEHNNYGGNLAWARDNFNARTISVEVAPGTGSGGNYDFIGGEVKPQVTVATATGRALAEGVDYSLTYADNVMPGTGSVIVSGIGDYRGRISAEFIINPIKFSFRDVVAPEQIDVGCELTVEHPFLEFLDVTYEISSDGILGSNGGVITGAKMGNTIYTVVIDVNGIEYAREYSVDVVPHSWDKGTVVEPADYSGAGLGVKKCERCGMEEYYDIPKLLGAPVGAKRTISGIVYRVASSSQVQAVKLPNKKSVAIPSSVVVNGKRYTVTSIASKACYKKTKVKNLVIGANVKKIGSKAFYGCKNLRSVVVKGSKISSFGSNSFGKIHAKAKAKVPKSCRKTYKKKFKKAGLKGRRQKVV